MSTLVSSSVRISGRFDSEEDIVADNTIVLSKHCKLKFLDVSEPHLMFRVIVVLENHAVSNIQSSG